MIKPTIAADGHTYEKAAIEDWLLQHDTSPVTGNVLNHTCLVPNDVIKQMLANPSS